MKKNVCKVTSIIMVILAIVAILGAITVTGGGFLDLSNVARYFLIGGAVIFGIIAFITGKYGWKSNKF